MWADLKSALRSLLKSPGFTISAVLILAIGIGANTAIFSAFNAVLLRSLPVPDPQNLRTINWSTNDTPDFGLLVTSKRDDPSGSTYDAFSYSTFELFRDHAVGFDGIFSYALIHGAAVKTPGTSAAAEDGLFVSGNFFGGYGGQALLGRLLNANDDRAGAAPVAVITHELWAERFALDLKAVGQSITINNVSIEIVGILPRAYQSPLAGDPPRFYVPNALSSMLPRMPLVAVPPLTDPSIWSTQVMGRRNPRVSEQQAQASLDVLFKQSLQAFGKSPKPDKNWHVVMESGRHGSMSADAMQKAVAKPMYVLGGAAAALLVLTCANLTGLMLARASSREREWAVRAAIGAGRWTLVRQPIMEAILLAAAGCLVGLFIAFCAARTGDWIIPRLLPAGGLSPTASFRISLDSGVLAFALVVSLVTAFLCGLLPALHASRIDPLAQLKKSSQAGLRQGAARALIGGQVTLSILLLIGAGLLARTAVNLSSVAPGFNPQRVLLAEIVPGRSDDDEARKMRFFDNAMGSIAAIPGVNAASLSNMPLLGGYQLVVSPTLTGSQAQSTPITVNFLNVGDSFLATMRIPLLAGREFTARDSAASEHVAMVNEEFARRYLKGQNPVDTLFQVDGMAYRVVGLVRDSAFQSVKVPVHPLIYFSFRQNHAAPRMVLEVRSALPQTTLVAAIQKAVDAIDPAASVLNVRTQGEQILSQTSTERLLALFSSGVALIAAFLCGFGLFGLLAYSVTRRTSEIGIRAALGAQRADVIGLIVGQGVRIVALGAIAASVVALWATKFLSGFLFGVKPIDPLTIVSAVLALALVAAVAAYLPARRATRVDPLVALRAE